MEKEQTLVEPVALPLIGARPGQVLIDNHKPLRMQIMSPEAAIDLAERLTLAAFQANKEEEKLVQP